MTRPTSRAKSDRRPLQSHDLILEESFNEQIRLAGRKALVTGGARGLGAGMAAALSRAGAAVMIGDVLTDLGRETAKSIAGRRRQGRLRDPRCDGRRELAGGGFSDDRGIGRLRHPREQCGGRDHVAGHQCRGAGSASHVGRQRRRLGAWHEACLPRHETGRIRRQGRRGRSTYPPWPQPSRFRGSLAIPRPSRASTA